VGAVIFFDATPYSSIKPTGAGRYVTNILYHLSMIDKKNRYKVFGFEKDIPYQGKWGRNFTFDNISISSWMGPLAMEIARRRYVHKALQNSSNSILHCNLDPVPLTKANVKTVLMLYDVMRINPVFQAQWRPSLRDRARTWLRYSKAAKCHALLTISEYSKKQISEKLLIPPERITVTHLAAREDFSPGKGDWKLLKGLGIKKPFIIFVGEFGRQKNENNLIRAFLSAKNENELASDFSLVLVGNPNALPPDISKIVLGNGGKEDIIITGNVTDQQLVSLYREAMVFALPSFDEGFGLPTLEAMSCATPVIVGKAGSLPEIVGNSGRLVDPHSIEDIQKNMVELCQDKKKRDRLTQLGLKQVKNFSFNSAAKKTLDLYRELNSDIE